MPSFQGCTVCIASGCLVFLKERGTISVYLGGLSQTCYWEGPVYYLVHQEGPCTLIQLAESLYFSFTDQGVAGTASGSVWYINWAEGSRVKLVYGHAGQVVGGATSSDGLLLATCCLDGSVAVWNMESLEQTVVFQAPKKVNPLPTTESCRHLTITSRNVCVSRLLHLRS